MGFEPMKELPLYTLSKRAPSTTRPPLHNKREVSGGVIHEFKDYHSLNLLN